MAETKVKVVVGRVITDLKKVKLQLNINTNKLKNVQVALTDDDKLAIAKLFFTDILKSKYDNYADDKANKTLDNVSNNDFIAKLTSVGVNAGIFGEFKGVLAAAPAGDHQDTDWYINSTDNHLYMWHSNKWNSIGNTTSALDKAGVLALLGMTQAQLNILLATKGITQAEKDKIAQLDATFAPIADVSMEDTDIVALEAISITT